LPPRRDTDRRDRDLRRARFLATDRWPAITFQASTVQASTVQASTVQASGAGWTIAGTLTVKDRDCPIRLDVGGAEIIPNDPASSVNVCASARLDRRSVGVNSAPAFLIGHTILLSLAIRLRPPAAVPAALVVRVTKEPWRARERVARRSKGRADEAASC
jgi:polyisoprenoid-binding protein YceI